MCTRIGVFVAALAAAATVAAPPASAGFGRGDLFVADHAVVVEYDAAHAAVARYSDPRITQLIDLAFDAAGERLYATDAIAHDVKVFDSSGAVVSTFGADTLSLPRPVAVHPSGDVYVGDTRGGAVDVFDRNGAFLRAIPVALPIALAFSADGNTLYVSQSMYSTGVQAFDLAHGDAALGAVGQTASQVVLTNGLAVAPDGTLYVGDGGFGRGTDTIKVFGPDGAFRGILAGGLNAPIDLTFDGAGNVWATNTNNFDGDHLVGYTAGGSPIASFGSELVQPTGLEFLAPVPAPVADAGGDRTIACSGVDGTAVTLDGGNSTGSGLAFAWRAEDGAVVATAATATIALAPGVHRFTLTVVDELGRSASDEVTITVRDTAAPVVTVSLSPDTIWPPDRRLVPVAATVAATDACDPRPAVTLVAVDDSESVPGDVVGAATGTDDRAFAVRAARSGTGSDRTYTVTYAATDASGNTATATAVVAVPHDRR